jgi:hypothetical protein
VNLVTNGDFSQGIAGWTRLRARRCRARKSPALRWR